MTGSIVYFDLETTGVSVTKDRIVEFGAVKFNDGSLTSQLHLYINPDMPMPADASAVNGITDDMLADKPAFKEVAQQILDFFGDCYICGHNSIRFDVAMLIEEFARLGIQWLPDKTKLIDTYIIEKMLLKHSLIDSYKRYYGHDYSEDFGTAHTAIPDTLAVERVLAAQADKLALHDFKLLAEKCIDANALDIAGQLVRIDGIPCYNFGKWKGQAIMAHQDYANWMLSGADFSSETKHVLRQILSGQLQ